MRTASTSARAVRRARRMGFTLPSSSAIVPVMKTPLSPIWLLCICCGLATIPSARGQTTILSEDFEGIFPGEWLVANFDPDGADVYWGKVNSAFGGEGTHSGSSKAYCAGIGFLGNSANPNYDTFMMSVMAHDI